MAHDKGKKPSQGSLRVSCADLGDPSCRWEARGHNDAEVIQQMEQHSREAHNRPLDNQSRTRVHSVLHGKKAA
ncbi:MAG: DUF1059 domain-containing protein [Terriglobales bacterium]